MLFVNIAYIQEATRKTNHIEQRHGRDFLRGFTLLQMKSTVSGMKNTLNGINRRLDIKEDLVN